MEVGIRGMSLSAYKPEWDLTPWTVVHWLPERNGRREAFKNNTIWNRTRTNQNKPLPV